jgi:putative transposase
MAERTGALEGRDRAIRIQRACRRPDCAPKAVRPAKAYPSQKGNPIMSQLSNHPIRKPLRLKDFDYSQPGAYFVTIGSNNMRCIFGDIRSGRLQPSQWGEIAETWWNAIPGRWLPVQLDQYVLMPNHFHGILVFPETGIQLPPLSDVINWYKGSVTKAIRRLESDRDICVWHRRFHDHVVRDERDIVRIREYFALNPGRWDEIKDHNLSKIEWLASLAAGPRK